MSCHFFGFPVAWVVFRRTLSLNLVPSESRAGDKGLCAGGLLWMWSLGEVRDREEGSTVTVVHHQVGCERRVTGTQILQDLLGNPVKCFFLTAFFCMLTSPQS